MLHPTPNAFNRTELELKQLEDLSADTLEATFNRTELELKQVLDGAVTTPKVAFNRTELELKHNNLNPNATWSTYF